MSEDGNSGAGCGLVLLLAIGGMIAGVVEVNAFLSGKGEYRTAPQPTSQPTTRPAFKPETTQLSQNNVRDDYFQTRTNIQRRTYNPKYKF